MWTLIRKDLALQTRSLFSYLVLAVLVTLIFFKFTDGGEGIIYMFGTIAVMNTAFRAAHEDDKQKGFAFICTLPLKRATVVLSKFAGSLFVIIAGFGVVFCIDLAMRGFQVDAAYRQNLLGFSMLPSGMIILLGVFWLLFFKLGYIKAMSIVRFIFLAPFVAFLVASKAASDVNISEILMEQLPAAAAGLFLLALLAYWLFLAVSLASFRKADLS